MGNNFTQDSAEDLNTRMDGIRSVLVQHEQFLSDCLTAAITRTRPLPVLPFRSTRATTLPSDLAVEVFQFLSIRSLATLASCSRSFRSGFEPLFALAASRAYGPRVLLAPYTSWVGLCVDRNSRNEFLFSPHRVSVDNVPPLRLTNAWAGDDQDEDDLPPLELRMLLQRVNAFPPWAISADGKYAARIKRIPSDTLFFTHRDFERGRHWIRFKVGGEESMGGVGYRATVGLACPAVTSHANWRGSSVISYFSMDACVCHGEQIVSQVHRWTAGDQVHIEVDLDARTAFFMLNGTQVARITSLTLPPNTPISFFFRVGDGEVQNVEIVESGSDWGVDLNEPD